MLSNLPHFFTKVDLQCNNRADLLQKHLNTMNQEDQKLHPASLLHVSHCSPCHAFLFTHAAHLFYYLRVVVFPSVHFLKRRTLTTFLIFPESSSWHSFAERQNVCSYVGGLQVEIQSGEQQKL